MNSLQTTFVAALLTAIFVTTGKALGGKEGALIAFILASACHTIAYWYSDKIVLRIYGAKEIMRGIFIGTGALLLQRFHWVIYLFGAFLAFTGIKMLIKKEVSVHPEDNAVI